MKKFIFALSTIAMLFIIKNNVFASNTYTTLDSLIDGYGISGNREISKDSGNPVTTKGVESSDGPVLVIYNSNLNKFLYISNSAFVIYTDKYAHQTTNVGSSVSFADCDRNFNNVLSEIYPNQTGYFYHYVYAPNSAITSNSADIKFDGTLQGFNDWMENHPYNENDPNNINSDLPMLTYRTNSKSFYKFPNSFDVKGTFEWDYTEHNIYSNNPTDFVLDLVASARLDSGGHLDASNSQNMPIDTAHAVDISRGGTIVSTNAYSFAYKDFGKLVYATYGFDKFPLHDNNAQGMAEGYCVYIRTRQVSTGQTSAWKIFVFQGGIFTPAGYAEDSEGVKPLKPNEKDPPNSSPFAPFTSDNNTSAQSDSTSSNFQGVENLDPSSLIFTLKSIISSLGEIPSMLTQLLPFMPEWISTMIALSIGLLVVIGVVKKILG